jgi:hypothetical protein
MTRQTGSACGRGLSPPGVRLLLRFRRNSVTISGREGVALGTTPERTKARPARYLRLRGSNVSNARKATRPRNSVDIRATCAWRTAPCGRCGDQCTSTGWAVERPRSVSSISRPLRKTAPQVCAAARSLKLRRRRRPLERPVLVLRSCTLALTISFKASRLFLGLRP